MPPKGIFSGDSIPQGWFDETAQPAGWFDEDHLNAAASASYTLIAATRSFALAGVAAGLPAARRLVATASGLSLVGPAMNLRATRVLLATVSPLALSGVAANLVFFTPPIQALAAEGAFRRLNVGRRFGKDAHDAAFLAPSQCAGHMFQPRAAAGMAVSVQRAGRRVGFVTTGSVGAAATAAGLWRAA
jgi:hypothetical protein